MSLPKYAIPRTTVAAWCGGPLWAAPIIDSSFVRDLLPPPSSENLRPRGSADSPPPPLGEETSDECARLLGAISKELDDAPLFFGVPRFAAATKAVRGAAARPMVGAGAARGAAASGSGDELTAAAERRAVINGDV